MGSREVDLIRLKVKRAEEHLAYYKDLILGRVGPIKTPDTGGLHYDVQRKTTEFHTDVSAPLPEWSIAIGDVIHQLRGCLDHLVFSLASRRDPKLSLKEIRALSFPLAEKETDFQSDWRVSKGLFLSLIGKAELAQVELAQPYKRKPSNPTKDLLYVLAKLNDIDKHRAILVLSNQLAVSELLPKFQSYSRQEMKPGTERFALGWDSSVKPTEVDMQHIHMRISIREPGIHETENSASVVLAAMAKEVSAVLDDFDRFF